jgi:hypothetical protein
MRHVILAGAAALVLGACGQQSSGPPLPPPQAGAQAPSVQAASTAAQQAMITPEQRAQLEQLVGSYLNTVQTNYGGGMSPAQGFTDQIAGLQPGSDHRWQVNLAGGTGYRIVGACDNECSNMDIELIDMRTGGVVASDLLPDDYPVVDFTPPANGQYVIRMLMQTCTVAPCYAGARILTAGGGGTPGK